MFLINHHETLSSFLSDSVVSSNAIKLSFALDIEKFQEHNSENRVYILNVWLTAVSEQAEKIKSAYLKVYFDQFSSLQEKIIETLEEINDRILQEAPNTQLSLGHYSIPGIVPPFVGLHIGRFIQEMRRDCPNVIFDEYLNRLGKIFNELS